MKYLLRFDAFALLATAILFLGITFLSPSESAPATVVNLPICIMGILVGSALLEVDRRLNKLEVREVSQDAKSIDG